ncbi:MAG: glycosyl transferase, group 1 family protein, partial [Phenylobacterium sp.]|nr:glycosyl transferase, group 1 family protein [Phenylobacterium sp.]
HDDYSANTGGVQLCLQREATHVAALGRDHLHLYPAKPWPVVRASGEVGPLGLLLNGERLGVFAPRSVASALAKAAGGGRRGHRSFAIHSLLGHNADETADILSAAGLKAGFFWLHDFASLCAGYHLFRNDVEDCAAPPPDSAACGICIYGPWRARHLAEHERLFQRLELTVASPSQPALDLWQSRWSFPAKAAVVAPLARLVDRAPAPAVPAGRPLRFAYLGMPVAHKGWPIFQELALRHADDPRYEFLHLGGREHGGLPVEFHKVVVTDEAPRAMQDALERLQVDVAMIWSLCRETFSFTTYEAVAAGAAVITGPDSGNIAAFVEAGNHGRVMADEASLAAALASGEITALARSVRKPRLYDLAFSALTVDLLEGAR